MPLPTISIKDIPADGLEVDAPLDAAWTRTALDETGMEPVGDPAGRARVRLSLHGRNVLLSGDVRVNLKTPCVRCLESVAATVHAEFTLHLEPAPSDRHSGRAHHEEIELSEGDLDVDHYENDRIELGQWVREQILLEAPAFPSCPEGCAAPILVPNAPESPAEDVDPRLAPLKKLFNKE